MASKEIKKGTPSENKESEHIVSEFKATDGKVATNSIAFLPDGAPVTLRKDDVSKASL